MLWWIWSRQLTCCGFGPARWICGLLLGNEVEYSGDEEKICVGLANKKEMAGEGCWRQDAKEEDDEEWLERMM